MEATQYAKTITNLSQMTVGELWQHYAELNNQPVATTLEHRCITLAELENRGVRGMITEGTQN